MSAHRRPAAILVVLGLALGLAGSAAAQSAGYLALEIQAARHGKGKHRNAESMARHVRTHLTPLLESLGYQVDAVHDAKKAMRSGDYHFAVKLRVDARPVFLVHEARQYRKRVVSDHDTGISTWAEFKVYGWRKREGFANGKVGPVDSRVHEFDGGRPYIDEEESVGRVFAGEIHDVLDILIAEYRTPTESLVEPE
ncbi:MAG: hypothetical protein AAF533_19780 [Acidobacteriota bacterium]